MSFLKKIVTWEYHFQLKLNEKRKLSEKAILNLSIQNISSLVSIFVVLPLILIVGAHILMSLENKLEINKWIGSIPPLILLMTIYVLIQKRIESFIFKDLTSLPYNPSLRNKMIILRISFFFTFLASMVYVVYVLKFS